MIQRPRGHEFRGRLLTDYPSSAASALVEAGLRGLAEALAAEFPAEASPTADALIFCDLTTGPDGRSLAVEDRLAEIRNRYAAGSVVVRFVDLAEEQLISAVRRTQQRLAGGEPRVPI